MKKLATFFAMLAVFILASCAAPAGNALVRDEAWAKGMLGRNFEEVRKELGIPTQESKLENGTTSVKYLQKKTLRHRRGEYSILQFEYGPDGIITGWGLHPISSRDVVYQLDREKLEK